MDLCKQLFPVGEGSHATPSRSLGDLFRVSRRDQARGDVAAIAPNGPIYDAEDYRRRFPDGRIGSDPSQATVEAGEKLVAARSKA